MVGSNIAFGTEGPPYACDIGIDGTGGLSSSNESSFVA